VAAANTVLEVASFANPAQRLTLANKIAESAHATALAHLRGANVNLEIIIVSRDGEPLGRAGSEMPRAAQAGRPA
jgi:cobalamin biosynthesis protein CbiD